ncbi:uncharacterized protein LOC128397079 isoform X1 [Panonychus citri]|uniref:uncharacterized protein LOC128397079 isoform X1 n=1 Tax=Panonychus citri TaxID=50023 RepID=UPI0023073E1F|nr:uncharacterized protein LOC128397079 isoform X1 [Panonychus citri]
MSEFKLTRCLIVSLVISFSLIKPTSQLFSAEGLANFLKSIPKALADVFTSMGEESPECPNIIATALTTCEKPLLRKLGRIEHRMDKGSSFYSDCCYYAQFHHCMFSKVNHQCHQYIDGVIDHSEYTNLEVDCSEYHHENLICRFVDYHYIIISIAVIFVLIVFCYCTFVCQRNRPKSRIRSLGSPPKVKSGIQSRVNFFSNLKNHSNI